jgi:hypothetical protein
MARIKIFDKLVFGDKLEYYQDNYDNSIAYWKALKRDVPAQYKREKKKLWKDLDLISKIGFYAWSIILVGLILLGVLGSLFFDFDVEQLQIVGTWFVILFLPLIVLRSYARTVVNKVFIDRFVHIKEKGIN